MKKWLLFDTWKLEELESWFSYMAEKGWHLVELKRGRAFFEKGESRHIQYRIDTFRINELKGQSKIAENELLGWQYVDSIGYIHIFREKEFVNPKEIYRDPIQHANSLVILQRNHLMKTLFMTFFVFLLGWLQWTMIENNITTVFLDNQLFLQLLLFSVLLYVLFTMFGGVFYLAKLSRKLKEGYKFQRNLVNEKKIKLLKLKNLLLATFGVFVTVMSFVNIYSDEYLPIPDGEIPIVKLTDILEDGFENIQYDDTKYVQYYKKSTSFFTPTQLELVQGGEMPRILSRRYQFKYETIAKIFVSSYIKEEQFFGTYEKKIDQQLDELWTIEHDEFRSFIARSARDVYVVNYFGVEPMELLIKKSIKK